MRICFACFEAFRALRAAALFAARFPPVEIPANGQNLLYPNFKVKIINTRKQLPMGNINLIKYFYHHDIQYYMNIPTPFYYI